MTRFFASFLALLLLPFRSIIWPSESFSTFTDFCLLATFIKVGHKNFMYSGYWVLIGFLLPFHPHSVVNFPSRFIKIVACLLGKSKGRKQAHFLFFSLARSMMPITSPNFHPHPKVKSTKKKPNRRKKRERSLRTLRRRRFLANLPAFFVLVFSLWSSPSFFFDSLC